MTGRDYLLYAAVVFAWGTSWYALKLQLGVVPPEVSLFWRFLMAGTVMFAWARIARVRLGFTLRDHLRFAAMGACLFSLNFIAFFYAGKVITSGLLAVVFSLTAVSNILLGLVVFREAPEARVAFGALLGFGGVALMFWPEVAAGGVDLVVLGGLGLCLTGVLLFSSGNMISAANHRHSVPMLSATAWGMAYGTLLLAIISLVRGHSFAIDPSSTYIGSLMWLTLISSVIAFASYITLIGRIGAARTGYATVMFPVVALTISTVLEGYAWPLLAIIGLGAVLVGNVLVLGRAPRPR